MPLRVIFRRAIEDGDLVLNPTRRLRLPAVSGRRERIAAPDEAQRLLEALSGTGWIDLGDGALRRPAPWRAGRASLEGCRPRQGRDPHVERAYDETERTELRPKSQAGRRGPDCRCAPRRADRAQGAPQARDCGFVFGSIEWPCDGRDEAAVCVSARRPRSVYGVTVSVASSGELTSLSGSL